MFNFRPSFFIVAALCLLAPSMASAHQPRIVEGTAIDVIDPEISKAYYGTLSGKTPTVFTINSSKPFALYVNILAPDIKDQQKDFAVLISKDGNNAHPLEKFDGTKFAWTRFWEPFGRNWYWQGQEYKADVGPGMYQIYVTSESGVNSRYSLAIGEKEFFDFKEGWRAVQTIPKLKKNFFNESPIMFLLSPFGYGYVIAMFALAFIFGFLYRVILKKFASKIPGSARARTHNIGKNDRLLRAALALFLFALAITTSWSPYLLFFSGFCLFEAIFSWCGLYAALGKNTCPL